MICKDSCLSKNFEQVALFFSFIQMASAMVCGEQAGKTIHIIKFKYLLGKFFPFILNFVHTALCSKPRNCITDILDKILLWLYHQIIFREYHG